jgi:hypothetical protein
MGAAAGYVRNLGLSAAPFANKMLRGVPCLFRGQKLLCTPKFSARVDLSAGLERGLLLLSAHRLAPVSSPRGFNGGCTWGTCHRAQRSLQCQGMISDHETGGSYHCCLLQA